MDFRLTSLSVGWITTAIQTTTPKHRDLRKISIRLPPILASDVDIMKKSAMYGEWLDLDRFLVQSCESRSTRPKVMCTEAHGKRCKRGFTECLLPELTRRGMLDLVG